MVYPMESDFYDVMRADTRELDFFLSLGSSIDPTSADDVTSIVASCLPFANPGQLTDAVYDIEPGITTFEAYGIRTAVSAGNIAPPLEPTSYPPEYGYWSDVISDENGDIDWTLTVNLSAKHTSAFTVYTREVDIAEAEVTFYADGVRTGGGAMESDRNSMKFTDPYEYDSIVIHVTKLEAPYRHVRISEIEFGASKTINKNTLVGTVRLIWERDPLMTSLPLWELDFTILNVFGEYDPDNPSGHFFDLLPSYPVEASVSCYSGDLMWTVLLGRYIVADKDASETELSVVCYDPRKALQDLYMAWEIKTDSTLGTQIDNLMTDLHIPHEVSEEVFAMNPSEAFTSSSDNSLLDVFLWIQQYYDIYLVPGRDGSIHVLKGLPSGDYGDMDVDMEYTYPLPYQFTTYNVIAVGYGPTDSRQTYTLDLRKDTTEVQSQLSYDNPMFLTLEKAQEFGAKIKTRLYSQMVEIEWRTDATLDIGDSVGLTGRWSDEAVEYTAVYQDLAYDGSLTAHTRGIL